MLYIKNAPPESFRSPPLIEYPFDQPEQFVCLDLIVNGSVCGQLFDSLKALQLHRANGTRFGGDHGALTITSLVLTNRCLIVVPSWLLACRLRSTSVTLIISDFAALVWPNPSVSSFQLKTLSVALFAF